MMRAVLCLGMIAMASASTCTLDSGDAVSSALDSVLNIWASTKRCKGPIFTNAPVKCEQDVASSIESVTKMAGAIASMLGDCGGGLDQDDVACTVSAEGLISSTAGLAAASGKIADKCFKTVPAQYDGDILDEATLLGKCVSNGAGGVNSLFKASNGIQDAKKSCETEGKKCTTSTLNVVSIIGHMGGFIGESLDDCSASYNKQTGKSMLTSSAAKNAECVGAVMDGIGDLTKFAALALNIEKDCGAASSRLYLESDGTEAKASMGNPTFLALAAMLPISAVLSFVAGSRFAKNREQRRMIPTEEELE